MTQNWKQFIQQYPISTPSSKILVDLSRFGIIKVSGADAGKFLQGQLTCDVLSLQSGQQTLGAYCNIQGKVTCLLRLWHLQNDYYIRLQTSLVDETIQELNKYAIFSKVNITDISAQFAGFGLYHEKINSHYANPQIAILTISPTRHEIFGPVAVLEHAWQHYIKQAAHADPQIWDILDIQDQLPELYPQTVGSFFAHDLNLPNLSAVSFTKGCFRGQEIVARMQHRGKLKRSLYSFTTNLNNINPGDTITCGGPEQESITGTVVRASKSTNDQIIGLAVITDSMVESSSKLYINNNSITVKANV